MNFNPLVHEWMSWAGSVAVLAPVALMLAAALFPSPSLARPGWSRWPWLSALALAGALVAMVVERLAGPLSLPPGLQADRLGLLLAVLVQFLGMVIGVFSARYLEGEPGQRRYQACLGGVMAAVQVLLLADHWLLLIAAWAAVGLALQPLLCFYADRPFALLAAHKKRLADRLADVLLLVAAGLAWTAVGSGSLSELKAHLGTLSADQPASPGLQAAAVLLVLAVMLRTALLPVHGWLIQVMEAPTPVSALLHAGVVNLGGVVLIRMAPLLEAAPAARALLVVLGLATALLAGLVMLTRISIKVRLAWSTVAQMGFMVLECGLGLYTLALLHLIGHSLYKAHAFLSASMAVQQTRQQMLRGSAPMSRLGLISAPFLALTVVWAVQAVPSVAAWPWWWSGVLALAWAPLLWWPAATGRQAFTGAGSAADRSDHGGAVRVNRLVMGLLFVAGLTALALTAHALPLGVTDRPDGLLGPLVLGGMGLLHLALITLHWAPGLIDSWRRWSYAGFYVDEFYTRLALWCWPTQWAPATEPRLGAMGAAANGSSSVGPRG